MKMLQKKRPRLFGLWLAAGIVSFLTVVACNQQPAASGPSASLESQPSEKEAAVLKIADSTYRNADFEKYVRDAVGENTQGLEASSLSRLFDKFVEEMLFLQAAREQGLSLSWEEKRNYLAKLNNESWPKGESSVDSPNAEGLFDKLLIEKYIYKLVKDVAVTDEEIAEYYKLHRREFLQPERVKVSQILLPTEEKAVDVLKRLENASEEEFRKIAQAESVGAESAKGGEMGLFKGGQLPFEMEKVIFSLKEGELSPVVESSYGYHIFRLDKRYQPELTSKEDAASSIKLKIMDQKISQVVSSHILHLRESLPWSSYPENLSFPYQRNIS